MVEYKRFGEGFVRREDTDDEWEVCQMDDIPAGFFSEEKLMEERRRLGYDPDKRLPFAEVLPNPKMEAVAAELGLSLQQLRGRLNDEPGGSKERVSEERFDEIAAEVGLTPEEIRVRFTR